MDKLKKTIHVIYVYTYIVVYIHSSVYDDAFMLFFI